jgi:spermidine synthase
MNKSKQTALIAFLLMCSGTCALIYQVAWLRQLQLVFGSTTASSAAVLAIFMGGLGIGNAVLGKRADFTPNPLRFYAKLEFWISLTAALTPLLIDATRWAYISLGGQMAMGAFVATLIRLLFSALVILLPTILMGGTLPAAVAAVTDPKDLNRRAAGLLYGCNTLGAVVGTLACTFLLLPWIGTRSTLWTACCLNVTVAVLAGLLSRYNVSIPGAAPADRHAPSHKANVKQKLKIKKVDSLYPPLVYASAAVVGFGFMLMELVWYRMLAPILGGTTYTFGLILAVALLGIGIGGVVYPLLFRENNSPSLRYLSLTCGLEAILIAIPFALGDHLAYEAAILQIGNQLGFGGLVLGWFAIASVVVLPASIVSGVQFPLLIALLGQAKQDVGKQLGYTYVSNTFGSILGSLAGGFGLLPLLSALGAWRLVVAILIALSVFLALLTFRRNMFYWRQMLLFLGVNLGALLLITCYTGPTAFWRHGSIGAGRAQIPHELTFNNVRNWENIIRRAIVWQADGVEAGVAITARNSVAFLVNGKSDGNAILDAGTQVGLGILPAILHPEPKTCLVVGLGTGETAGWLAMVNSVKRLDVVEIEPSITEMARRCASLNCDVLTNPKVQVIYNDAREVLLTTNSKYDIIASEPSNPYRAGIANLYTREFYLSANARLNQEGLFVQWLQAYEIDETTAATVFATLKSVFKFVEVWQSKNSDLLLLCSQEPIIYDSAQIRARIRQEPYRTALMQSWRADQIEGFLARYVGGDTLTEKIAQKHGNLLNTDDLNILEFGFARTLGRQGGFSIAKLREEAELLSAHRPKIRDKQIDWQGVEDERMALFAVQDDFVPIPSFVSGDQIIRGHALKQYLAKQYADMVVQWESQSRRTVYPTETALLALAYVELGNDKASPLIDRLRSFNETEAKLLRGILLFRQSSSREATDALSQAFVKLRNNPWPLPEVTEHALNAAIEIAKQNPAQAGILLQSLEQPFAIMFMQEQRKRAACLIASQIGSSATLPWIEAFEPYVPWNKQFLELRVRTYTDAGSPMQSRAESDLQLFRDQEAIHY